MNELGSVADLLNRCVVPGERHRGYVSGDDPALAPKGALERLRRRYGVAAGRLGPRLAALMPGCLHVVVWLRG